MQRGIFADGRMSLRSNELRREPLSIVTAGDRAPRFRSSLLIPVQPLVDGSTAVCPKRGFQSLTAFFVSMLLHGSLLVGMACIVFEQSDVEVGSLSGVLGKPTEDTDAELFLEAPVVADSGGTESPSELENLVDRLHESQTRRMTQTALTGVGDGSGAGEGSGDDDVVALPAVHVPSYAVTKGSFSAWTEPEDPEPGRDYTIRIVVQLPSNWEKSTRFRMRDISGMVIGTDGYRQAIRFRPTQTVIVQDGSVQIDIPVPGARRLVRDTIRIESKLLKEKQIIQLVF